MNHLPDETKERLDRCFEQAVRNILCAILGENYVAEQASSWVIGIEVFQQEFPDRDAPSTPYAWSELYGGDV